jgi:hypothetical protein
MRCSGVLEDIHRSVAASSVSVLSHESAPFFVFFFVFVLVLLDGQRGATHGTLELLRHPATQTRRLQRDTFTQKRKREISECGD